jgi:lysyl-tRNA synthetase class 1
LILSPLNFTEINEKANKFADFIESHFEEIADILLEYESFEVVQDEVDRTLDHLRSLKENQEYFALRVGAVTSFLPRNQPLYALTCFVIVPSLMATEVHFRIPHSMRVFLPRLLRALKLNDFFANITVSNKERLSFLKERSALLIDTKTEESIPATDVVIFTGTSAHAERLRLVFDQRTLFIANGSGHNPVVVSEDADITKAVEATLSLQLYNQGQDCANPNAILVHRHSYKPFINKLREAIKKVRVGQYRDRLCRVGPISDPEDLTRIQNLLVENREWLDSSTPGIIRTADAIVEPTIICKPLSEGGNFTEVFSPIIFVQEYSKDEDLVNYFENSNYARNAMYVSVYGTSKYVNSLLTKKIEGKILHDRTTILFDAHLHEEGKERGTQPYGGYGYAASSFSINGHVTSKPTLPQRDIYENLVKPLLSSEKLAAKRKILTTAKKTITKDVQKLLGFKSVEVLEQKKKFQVRKRYIDALDIIASDHQRYLEFLPDRVFTLLPSINVEHVATMEPKHLKHIRSLYKFLSQKNNLNKEEFTHLLYQIPKKPDATNEYNKKEQLDFFKNIYHLLLGKDSGPRLVPFLMDADRQYVLSLLNI